MSGKNTLYLEIVKNRKFPGEFQSSKWFLEDSRNDGILEFWIENQVPWQKLSGKNTLYLEIGKNKPNPGDSRISGCLDSRIQKSKNTPKNIENYYDYAIGVIFYVLSKTALFWKVVKSLGKSGSWKKTKSIDELILTWKFFLLKHQSCLFLKVFKIKVVSDFWFDAF